MITALRSLKTLEAQRVEDQCDSQAGDQRNSAGVVGRELTLTTREAELFEILESQFSDVASLPTITAGGFTGSDLTIESNIHTLDFSVVDAARVISTGSWSRPGVDHFATDGDAHRVSRIDRLDAVPTNGNLLKRISDCDALVEDCDSGMDKEQVISDQYEATPRNSDEVTFKSTGRDGLNNQGDNDHGGNASAQPNSARSKSQNVGHLHSVILSQQSGLEGSQA